MASYKLAELAEEDLWPISIKTIEKWAKTQAQRYGVYEWKSDEEIEVARILHQRMDVLAALECPQLMNNSKRLMKNERNLRVYLTFCC